MKKAFKNIFKISVYVFAIWGFVLTGVFFAMKFGLTKSGGLVDTQSDYFKKLSTDSKIGDDERVAVAQKDWANIKYLDEWQVIKVGLTKDAPIINRVSQETGVDSRLLITPLVAEQLRLMTSERDLFKKYFAPLGLLGNQTQFSLGIFGIKENTAKQIEDNLKNPASIYYLGSEYEHALDYTNSTSTLVVDKNSLQPIKNSSTSSSTNATSTITLVGSDAQRIMRLTNDKDHYYSYLYAALYLKQIMTAWERSGYSISDRPEIIATVYNLGFEKSNPNPDPKVGGAEIDLVGNKYSFGSIAFYFYFSNDLTDVFPR